MPFKEALVFARALKLKTQKEWQGWSKSGTRPAYIPSTPDQHYKRDGWQGYRHWLGTGTVAHKDRQFLQFKKAMLYARSLKLKTRKEWDAWSKSGARPANMPSTPNAAYTHEGWRGYGHWLGTGTVAPKDHQFLPFKEALLCARSLKLQGKSAWVHWSKSSERPANMPSTPNAAYKHDGWQGYGHWLGTVNIRKMTQFLQFKQALLYARSWKLQGKSEWDAWAKSSARPANIPHDAHEVYKHEGWQGYAHWLGTGNVFGGKKHDFLPFEEALLHARSLMLKNVGAWDAWRKSGARPANIPSNPYQTFEHDGWQGWGHWLGT